jgi:hypothetical protein
MANELGTEEMAARWICLADQEGESGMAAVEAMAGATELEPAASGVIAPTG